MRTSIASLCLFLAACGSAPRPKDEKADALLARHAEVWKMMGLSENAQKELNSVVVSVHGNMEKNRSAHPELFALEPKRAKQLTHDEFIAAHQKRLDALKISAPTQKELLKAAEFVWTALHDSNVSEKDRQLAAKIRDMMKMGPPPCCDDNIFRKAQ
ncbi:MAG: hypothetical protein HYY16_04505 [Planctomycetes bacterium]|nr:hypothetical protein [Planctomycetota bacterium]